MREELEILGGACGYAGGMVGGAKVGMFLGSLAGPPGVVVGALAGGIAGAILGLKAGARNPWQGLLSWIGVGVGASGLASDLAPHAAGGAAVDAGEHSR